MRRPAAPRAAALAAIALLAAAGCASTATSAKTQPTAPPTITTSSPASASVSTPASAPVATSPPAASRSTGPVSQPPTGACLDHAGVLYPGSDNPLRSTCVRVGGTVTITLTATGAYRWSTPATTNPAAAAITAVRTDADGTLHAVVTARAPGIATISAADTFTPDPHGPPSHLWTLTVTVQP